MITKYSKKLNLFDRNNILEEEMEIDLRKIFLNAKKRISEEFEMYSQFLGSV